MKYIQFKKKPIIFGPIIGLYLIRIHTLLEFKSAYLVLRE